MESSPEVWGGRELCAAVTSLQQAPRDRIWGWEGSRTRRGHGCACSALGEPCCVPGPSPCVSKSPAAWARPGGLTGAVTAAAGPQAAGLEPGLGQAAAVQGLCGALLGCSSTSPGCKQPPCLQHSSVHPGRVLKLQRLEPAPLHPINPPQNHGPPCLSFPRPSAAVPPRPGGAARLGGAE